MKDIIVQIRVIQDPRTKIIQCNESLQREHMQYFSSEVLASNNPSNIFNTRAMYNFINQTLPGKEDNIQLFHPIIILLVPLISSQI